MSDEYAEPQTSQERSERNRRGLVALALIVALLILIAWWVFSRIAVVPDVVGMQESQARIAIEEAGFLVGQVKLDAAAVRPAGSVDAQGLAAGSWALKGQAIDLFVAGRQRPPVPVERSPIFDPGEFDDREGSNIRERGEAGSEGTGIPDREYRAVPTVLNLTESEALRRLNAAGLRGRVEYAPNAGGVDRGRVFYQTPAPGDDPTIPIVEIWVSTGPPDFGTPYREPNKP